MQIEAHRFADDGRIPNSVLPLLVYRGALAGSDLAVAFERRFAVNDWRGAWRDGIFAYHHFHSTSHEVLGIAEGEAMVRFGGERGDELAGHGGRRRGHPGRVLGTGWSAARTTSSWSAPIPRAGRGMSGAATRPNGRRCWLTSPRSRCPRSDPLEGADGPLLRAWTEASGDL